MRLLVISDAHGLRSRIESAIELHPEADAVIFLGDGARDLPAVEELYPDKKIYAVCGNCDVMCCLPETRAEIFGGKRVFFTHGHLFGAKGGEEKLRAAAREAGADILLYGHTHTPVTDYEDGLYIMNPGALLMSQYGMVDITPSGILCTTAYLV